MGARKKDQHYVQVYLEKQTQLADDGHGMFEWIKSGRQ